MIDSKSRLEGVTQLNPQYFNKVFFQKLSENKQILEQRLHTQLFEGNLASQSAATAKSNVVSPILQMEKKSSLKFEYQKVLQYLISKSFFGENDERL